MIFDNSTIKCILIGNDSLASECIKRLLNHPEYELLGIISNDPLLHALANEHRIAYYLDIDSWLTNFKETEFDYLFSVMNEEVLSANILKMPRQAAINYHDSLLPQYAGTHSTSWAILNNENTHGVTWHRMFEEIDTGDILIQVPINIMQDDTALILNMKCYEAALDTFERLIDNLVLDNIFSKPQDLLQRTYHSRKLKPENVGILDFNNTSEYLYRCWRAMYFGLHANDFVSCKLMHGNHTYIIHEMNIIHGSVAHIPGQIVSISKDHLKIATKTKYIQINALKTLDGRSCSISDFIKMTQLNTGDQLVLPSQKSLKQINDKVNLLFPYEQFWVNELKSATQMNFPYFSSLNFSVKNKTRLSLQIQLISKINDVEWDWETYIITLFTIYMYRLLNKKEFTLGILGNFDDTYSGLFSNCLPLNIQMDTDSTFNTVYSHIAKQKETIQQHNTYLGDLGYRYPELQEVSSFFEIIYPCFFEFSDNKGVGVKELMNTSRPYFKVILDKKNKECIMELGTSPQQDVNSGNLLQRIQSHICNINNSIHEDIKCSITKLGIIDQSEKLMLLSQSKHLESDLLMLSVVELFKLQVTLTPNNIAIVFNERSLTYRDLDRYSDQLALYILQHIAKQQANIIIFMNQSDYAVISMLAVLKINCIYVPLNPEDPKDRTQYLLNDVNAALILTDFLSKTPALNAAKSLDIPVIDVEDKEIYTQSALPNALNIRISPNDLAYILYTSGSTGNPNGVQIYHKSIVSLVKNQNYIQFTSNDVVAQFTSLTFDPSTLEIWGALLNGSKLIVVDKKLSFNPEMFHEVVKKECTILLMTVSVFVEIYRSIPDVFDNLKILMLGGETLRPKDIRSLLKRKKQYKLKLNIINGYGPTENTNMTTYYIIEKLNKGQSSVSIGKAISFTETYILDDYFNLLPMGVAGELYIGGAGISKGYINRQELNSEVFIRHPFSEDETARLYKTGDIVKRLADGNMVFLGRKDRQIKIRGIRVELGEIENRLLSHPSVRQGVVLAKVEKLRKYQLVAYIVTKDNNHNVDNIQRYMSQYLPDHMVPYNYVVLDKFPLTTNKKIDIFKLPDPIQQDTKNYQAPRNEKERLLASIWGNILNVKHIGRNDNFFALGGDSIIAMQIITKVNQSSWKIRASDIFHFPTIAKLAKKMKNQHLSPSANKSDNLTEGNVLLTPIQSWFFDIGHKSPSNFSQCILVKLNNKSQSLALEKSLDALIQHHDILRASFEFIEDKWQQVIKKNVDKITICREKLSSKKYESEISEMETILFKKYSEFELDKPPLIKIVIFQDKDQEYLSFIMHHLIIDAVSWRIFLDDFFMAYHTYINNQTVVLPVKSSSYKLWSQALLKRSRSNYFIKESSLWLQQAASFEMPVDFRRGENRVKGSKCVYSEFDLSKISLSYKQVRPMDILISALVITLSSWFKQKCVNFFVESHGRELFNGDLDLSRTIGWFTSQYPMKFILNETSDEKNYMNILKSVRKKISSIPNHGQGFGILKYLVKDIKLINEMNVSSLCFNYLGNFDVGFDLSEIQFVNSPIRLMNTPSSIRPYLIDISTWIKNDKLHIEWRYSPNFHKASTIQKLSNDYIKNINCVVAECLNSVAETAISSDYSLTKLTQDQLNICFNRYPRLENITQLAPVQKGFLFHHLQYPESHLYHSQFIWTDNRGLDLVLFKKAWDTLIKRHSIFRTRFLWKHFDYPIQIVESNGKLPWKIYDFSALSLKEQDIKISAIIREDQERWIDFSEIPLMRISVIKKDSKNNVIIWTHHHILLGGWSVNTALVELYEIYKALVQNKEYRLPQAIPFSEYIVYQIQRFKHNVSKRFWTKYLHNFSGLSVLKELGSIDEGLIPHSQQIEFQVPKDCAIKLKRFASENHISLNTVMLYAWILVISRYTNTMDVAVGIVVSTRPNDFFNNENIIGPLINTLPFRLILECDEMIQETLSKINKHILNITQQSHTGLLDIYSWLKRSTQEPLFDTLFVFENYPLNFEDENISDLRINDITHYPLALNVFPHHEIRLVMKYDSNALDQNIVENIMKNYYTALNELIKQQNSTANQINILSTREMMLLKTDWGDNKKYYPQNSIISLFETIVHENATKIAIRYCDEEITYKLFDQLTNQWANYLIAKGLKKGDSVVIYIDRSIEMCVAIYSVLKAGGVYVPIDLSFPRERIHFISQDVNATFIFTQPSLILNLDANDKKHFINIFDKDLIKDTPESHPAVDIINSDLAYVMYTSGTTGVPKGIQIQQKSVVNTIYSVFNEMNITKADKMLSFTSVAFDVSVSEILGALLWGMELDIASSDMVNNPSLLIQRLNTYSPTLIMATPALLQLMINAGWKECNGIKILSSGETLTQVLADKILSMGARLWNAYGPTETTIWSSIAKVEAKAKINIGRPIANTQMYVLDHQKFLVPIGAHGELYIGGDGLTKGYVNRPDLNEELFHSNSFLRNTSQKIYRTGDIVRWMANGNLEYIDRCDNQIKLRGYRIELEEIRTVILKHRSIQDCSVLKIGQTPEDMRLIAFYTLKEKNKSIAVNEINIIISAYLPNYMIPDKFVEIAFFPLNSNGKIDKKILLDNYCEDNKKGRSFAMSAKNPTEKLILNIFNKVLGVKNIGLNDNFFEMGGNSISAIRILSNIQDCFSISLSMHDILSMPTPYELAKAITQQDFQNIRSYDHIPSPIVCLQSKGDKPPLFLIHPVGGTIFWFVKLANLLGDTRPIYGLQDPGLFTQRAYFSTFESMATFYLNEIKNIQSDGPYYLAGASFGATMAVEIAKKFIAEDKKIAFVGLFDGWGLYPEEILEHKFLKKLMKTQYSDMLTQYPDINTQNIKPIVDISWHRAHLLADYQLDWIDCSLTLFKADKVVNALATIDSPHNHWIRHTPHLNIVSVPGDHESMFSHPNVEVLAKKLNEALYQCEYGSHEIYNTPVRSSQLLPIPWNPASISYPDDTVMHLFESMVEQDHSAFAAVFNGRCLTYEKLNKCANQLAHYLIDLGVTKGDIIGIHLDREFEMLIAVLGILKSGAAYAPFNLAEPPSRIDNMQNLCRAVITQKNLLRKFNLSEKKTICIDRDWQFIRHKSIYNPTVDINLDDVAIIMSSSASQVNPPGVIITHRNISNLIQWSLSEFSQEELIGVLASAPLGHELSIFEIFSPLCSGGAVHIVKTIENLSEVPFSGNITLLSTIPSCMNDLLKNQKIPKSIKSVILVNEFSDFALINNIYENTDIARVFNVYLQTEVGLLTSALLPRNLQSKPPIGKPIPNAKIYILNQNLEPVHAGTPGELYVSGDVLSLGYINNPDLMAAKFIDNPIDGDNKKLFKTNTLVTLGADGNLYFLGSSDTGLKIKGLYENPQEIEELVEG